MGQIGSFNQSNSNQMGGGFNNEQGRVSKASYFLPFLFALFLALGMILGSNFNPQSEGFRGDDYDKKLGQVLGYIQNSYVDTPNKEELVENAIENMLAELDPYSSYISAKDLVHANEQLEGNFEGIGVEFNVINDTVTVLHVIPGGPSEIVGILPGDQIIEVEGEIMAGIGIKNNDIISKLKGPKDTKVKVKIHRKNNKQLIDFEITRDKIKIESVVASYMLNDKTGYIKVVRFAGNTSSDFIESLEKLQRKGIKNLVVDLRGNPGGYLGAATAMVEQFLKADELITFTQGRSRNREEYKASGDGIFTKGNLVVLINEGSASASEIFSGAIQDLDRGLLVGTRSHGKGLVQEPIELKDGSQLRLTVARYYTPSGRCIQRPYDMTIENGSRDSLAQVFKTKSGREVKDGGGIIPDIEVASDSIYSNNYYLTIAKKGVLYELALEYFNLNREKLIEDYKNSDDFVSGFTTPNSILDSCNAVVKKSELIVTEKETKIAKDYLNVQFKAIIARYMWGDNAFYAIINNTDPVVQKALEAITENKLSAYGIN